MVSWVIMVVSLAIGVYFFKRASKKAEAQAQFLMQIGTAPFVRKKLNQRFTGYVLCLDAMRYPKSQADTDRIFQWIKNTGHHFFVFDAPSVFSDDQTIANDLQVEFLPALVPVKEGAPVGEALFIPSAHPQLVQMVENFVLDTGRKLIA